MAPLILSRHSLQEYIGEFGPEDYGCPACEEGVDGEEEVCNCWSDGEPDKGCELCGGKGSVVMCRKCGQVR